MRARLLLTCSAIVALTTLGAGQSPKRLNPMIELMAAKKPVFGLYAPSNRRFAGATGATSATSAPATKTAAQLAADATANRSTDFIFDGSMEGGMDRAL